MARMMEAKRHTTFSFTLEPTPAQIEVLFRHVGAARFAFNQCLQLVKQALASRDQETKPATQTVPWSGFDLINAFNSWKLTPAAGVDDTGNPGLPWRNDVCQQVFEEAAVDLGRGLAAFSSGRKGERIGRPPRFPRFKSRATARASFRIRNKGKGAKAAIRIGSGDLARSIRLPKLGTFTVRECTRDLRRMVRRERAAVLFATVSFRSDGRWHLTLNVEARAFHPARLHPVSIQDGPVVGIDRGLTTFAVIADSDGHERERLESPRPLRRELAVLRRKSKALSRKKGGSNNRHRARVSLARTHARIGAVRRDFVHRESSRLAKTHGHLVIEDLNTMGMMKTSLARSLSDSAWALFGTLLAYKAGWYGARLTVAHRFYPSTRRCSACEVTGDRLALSERRFRCSGCGHEADRDTNAAVNLARYPRVAASGAWSHVAAKHAETQNACGEGSSGERLLVVRETTLDEAGRASAQRPRRAVLAAKSVNTL